MAEHLSIFVENQPGKLEAITRLLADAGINLRAISVASGGEYGVVKLLVDDPAAAAGLLKEHHLTVSRRRIVAAVVDDRPGGLARLLQLLAEHRINVEDCYGFVLADRKQAAIIFETDQPAAAESALAAGGLRALTDAELRGL